MPFDPHLPVRSAVLDYFAARDPELVGHIEALFADPSLESGRRMLRAYFRRHVKGDVQSLRMATASFADKRLVRAIVASILADEQAMAAVAARSYPHPIGFDKLVLDDDRATGFKFRLHVYWRGANYASLERMHLHRFEMASAIVTGELTNHVWRVIDFRPDNGYLSGMDLAAPSESAASTRRMMPVYSGYRRDEQNQLRKTYLGDCTLERGASETYTSGDSYAQILEDAHFVETNAETGFANGDFCSTVYIHGPSLVDRSGRNLPVLFEEQRLADDNQLVHAIPALSVQALADSLRRYRDTLDEILKFYEWLYDPRHGRNLSAGMVAGYLLCEAFRTPHAIDVFERRYDECKGILQRHEATVRAVLEGRLDPGSLDPDDRCTRYLQLLVAKARAHAQGQADWLQTHGALTKEMWRYLGAIRGEMNPRITVLKPIWEAVVRRKLPGGMHYGHVAAMIEAAFDANEVAMRHFDAAPPAECADEHNITCRADVEVAQRIRRVLGGHYPGHGLHAEGDEEAPADVGERRFLIDPLDGTRNFVNHRLEFCIVIACQEWTGSHWRTTDGVVSHPPTGRIYWAERGQGAFVIERSDLERRAAVRPLAFDAARRLHQQLIDFSALGLGLDGQTELFRALLAGGARPRNSGSVALMLAQMAGQGGSGAVVTAQDHDVEAGLLIAQEAGSWTTQVEFEMDGGRRVATVVGVDAGIHDALLALVQGLLKRHASRHAVLASSRPG